MREQAILALLSEPTIVEAAARVGIGAWTLRRWLTDDAAFQAEYEAARRATFKAAISRIPMLAVRAVDTLAALLGDKEPPAVRLGAARTVADIGLHQYGAETILKKLDEIEARQAAEVEVCAPWEPFASASSGWRAPSDVVFYSTDDLTTCPHYGATLPSR